MRLEDLTAEKAKKLSKGQLWSLRLSSNQQWEKYFSKGEKQGKNGITRETLLSSFLILTQELEARGVSFEKNAPMDRICKQKNYYGIDTGVIGDVILVKDFICLTGPFLATPKSEDPVVLVKSSGFPKFPGLDLNKLLKRLHIDSFSVSYNEHDYDRGIPVFDLFLRAHPQTEVKALLQESEDLSDFQKPYPNEHAARLVAPRGFDKYRRQNNKYGEGVHAIWGIKGNKSTLQSIRFSTSKFSAKEAKAWLKEHDYHPTKFEAATKKKEDKKIKKKLDFKFIKVKKDQHIVSGLVYEPDTLDDDDEWATADDIKEAMYFYMEEGPQMGLMHKDALSREDVTILECFFADEDTKKDGGIVPAGSWYMSVRVNDTEIWKACKEKKLTGFSMAGLTKKRPGLPNESE